MDIHNQRILQKNKVVMHSQESYDHPIAYNENTKIPTTQKAQEHLPL